jgi:transcription initiation factor TFIID subunit TAF12
MSNAYDFSQAPNIAGAGNYAQMLAGLFRPQQQQQQKPQQGQQGQQGGPFQQGFIHGMLPKNPDGSINWAGLLGGGASQGAAQPVNPTQPGVPQPWTSAPSGTPWG